jgi:hypothetical protein
MSHVWRLDNRDESRERRGPEVPRESAWIACTSSVSHANRSCRGEGARRRHMKNPEAATPRIRQHRLAEKPCPASSAMTLAFGRTPSSTASRPA